MKFIHTLVLVAVPVFIYGQVRDFRELTTRQIGETDLNKTVVIIPGGLMEEHGPYLPLYTDGYTNEALARRVADSIYSATKYNVFIFPTIPLGVGSPEAFAGIKSFPGVVYLKPSTLRTVFMDIGDMLGNQGFKFIFVVFKHGAALHNRALNQASDYFNDTYNGKMVALTALQYDTWKGAMPKLTPEQLTENGIDIHSGMDETSRMLFNKPMLVDAGYKNALPFPVKSWEDFTAVTQSKEWQGYYGSPRLASAESGELIMNKFSHNLSELAINIIRGYDYTKLPKSGGRSTHLSDRNQDDTINKLAEEFESRQNAWIKANVVEQ
jgi:creatinine amidohydrolase